MLNQDRLIVSVQTEGQEQAEAVMAVLQEQGGHFINYFGTPVITTPVP